MSGRVSLYHIICYTLIIMACRIIWYARTRYYSTSFVLKNCFVIWTRNKFDFGIALIIINFTQNLLSKFLDVSKIPSMQCKRCLSRDAACRQDARKQLAPLCMSLCRWSDVTLCTSVSRLYAWSICLIVVLRVQAGWETC